jgi:hypothetical protein
MMAFRTLFALASLAGLPCSGTPLEGVPGASDATAGGFSAADTREILVTFADQRAGRVPVGDAAASYRGRGNYGISAWYERLAANLAERYGLVQRAQWPISSLGLRCVVYALPVEQAMGDVLSKLNRDPVVESAQPMHSYRAMVEVPRDVSGAEHVPGAGALPLP